MDWTKTKVPGIYVRHRKDCASHAGGKCRCKRSWKVRYRDETGPKWSKVFHDENEAKNWQSDRRNGKESEAVVTSAGRSFNDLADEFFALADSGAVPQKSGKRYGRGTLVAYKSLYNCRVRLEQGKKDAAKLTAKDWQLWVDALSRKGLKRNSISVGLNCVRAIYRWACAPTRMILSVNATRGLQLPAYDETPRDRVATPDEAIKLLDALKHEKCHPCDRVSYGLALYAGLRNVERLPLGWERICLNTNVIRIRTTKGEGGAGIRTLPVVAPLRTILLEEWERQGQPSKGLICRGPKGGAPEYNSMVNRACQAWEAAKLEAIGLHECRHTFITTMIAAGLNAKAVSVLAGHASIDVTFDRYGHLFPGSEEEAGSKLNAFYEPNTDNVVSIRKAA